MHGPNNAFRGQIEFWSGWLSRPDEERYRALLRTSTTLASNICATEGAYWRPGDLSRYPKERGPLDPPAKWPTYRLNKGISIVAGEKTATSGIYLPDVENSCAQFLSTSYKQAPLASVLVRMADLLDEGGQKYGEQPVFEERPCVWYLVERVDDVDASASPESIENPRHQRIPGGEQCQVTGFYFTPARPESRRLFQQGEVMPAFDSAYGLTIWQWDANQLPNQHK